MNPISNSNQQKEDSMLISILSLEKQYQQTLNQYEQAYQTYINLLSNNLQTVVSDYDKIAGPGSVCSGSSTWFPDGMWEKDAGYLPEDQCRVLCDENPYCSGYNLGAKKTNGTFSCKLFAETNTQVTNQANANGCYRKKQFVKPSTVTTTIQGYGIIGIGLDGKDYYKPSLTDSWQRLNNDYGNDLIACAVNPANNKYYILNTKKEIYTKNSYTDYGSIYIPGSCCEISMTFSPDGSISLMVGTDGNIWKAPANNLSNDTPFLRPKSGHTCISVAINPNGKVFYVSSDFGVYTNNSSYNNPSENWTLITHSCCVKSIAFAPDGTMIGVGTDNKLYTKQPNDNYSGFWVQVPGGACCVTSIATIRNSTTSSSTNIPSQFRATSNNKVAEFISIPGKNYWGKAPLSQGQVNSIQDCENMCASDINCSGATFQSSNKVCFTRTGMSEVVNGQSSDYALIPQVRQMLNTLKNLNDQLLNINQQIDTQIQALYPIAQQDQIKKNAKQLELNDNYAKLMEEKADILTSLQDYENLEKEYEDNSLNVNRENILYKFWSLFAILLLAITFKVIFKVNGSSFIFLIFTVIAIIITLSFDWWSLIPIILLPFLFKMIYYPSA